jgi:hypothetical protein
MRVLCPIVEAVANWCRSAAPMSSFAVEWARSALVTTNLGRPYPFLIRLRNFSAAALSRFAKPSPRSVVTARV